MTPLNIVFFLYNMLYSKDFCAKNLQLRLFLTSSKPKY